MAKSNGSGWDWSESLAERMRMQKNGNAVRWYVLTLPVSRRGHYQGEPARGLKAELDRRTRTGEPTFEYFAPSYIEVRKRRGELVDTRRPLLYNYVFVHASEAEIYRMKRFQPQYNFLPRIRTAREEYYPYLTDRAMENLRWVAASYSDVLPLYTPEPGQLMKGDRVRITEGQFKGVEATVISQPGAGRKEVMVCVEGCMYVPLLAVEPGQYEVIALNADNRHIYTRLGSSRLPDLLHEAMGRFHTPEGVTEEDRRTAREVLRQYGSLQLESDVMRCKLYAMQLPAHAILGDRTAFEQLLGTMRSILVSLYGCTNSCIYREEAHRAVDPWREENPVKKNKQQLIRRLYDYDRWLGHCPNAAGPERTAVIG